MSHFILRIDNYAIKAHTETLRKLHKSALPGAIRGTLNSAAFDVKQKSMPVAADKHFEQRKPNFFKANSKVVMATGWRVEAMKATVGFVSTSAKYNNYAVSELEQQEYGGTIQKRTLLPTDEARQGKTKSGEVAPRNRLTNINAIKFANKQPGVNRRQKFLITAIKAGVGGYMIGGLNKQMLYRIESIKRDGRRTVIRTKSLYSFRKGRSVRIKKATGFMREASLNSAAKLEKFYIHEANRQIQRLMGSR